MVFKKIFAAGKFKKLVLISAASVIAVSTLVYYFVKNQTKGDPFNPAFKAYVSAYTGGMISSESTIQIRFVSEVVKQEDLNKPIDKELFNFSPTIKGTAQWIDKNTIQFQPEENLPSGTSFEAKFEIGEVMNMPDDLQVFGFQFQTIPQTFDVLVHGLRTYDVHNLRLEKLHGTLSTADVADNAEVEKILTAKQDGRNLKISWIHDEDRRTHEFQVDSVKRTETKGKVELSWDGSSIHSETKGNTTYEVPALGDFILVSAKAMQGEEQFAELQFSDPLKPDQDLTGLITIENVPDLRLVIDENIIRAYPPVRQIGVKKITINQGIKNINDKPFPKTEIVEINFEEIKPSVRLIGKGVILPSTDGLVFPFEAVSLKSVQVKILKIYENNINQFFQVNNFDGQRELTRVGKVVLNKNISLNNTNVNDYAKWKRYALDLKDLINAEPGAIYQVKIGFKRKDVFYSCEGDSEAQQNSTLLEQEEEEDENEENQYQYNDWSYYEEEYYYDEDYNYEQRDNPCDDSYYGDYRSVQRNIFASDLGIIAKIGTSGNMVFTVTDLKTTTPIEGAKVEMYDFQQQLLKSENTNNEGMVTVDMKKKPFFLVVRKDKQVGYLKLDNNTALSISNFDVSGAPVQKGIKGFLYGERGVWRPGDSLYLTFILEDKLNTIPENQPVAFELVNPMGQSTKRIVANSSVDGFYNFRTATNSDDLTGNWTAKVKVGGADFSYPIKIETIMPNRLKIKLDFGTDKIVATNNKISGSLDVKWLHGAIAKNLDADISMQLFTSETKFEKYPEFNFDDPGKYFGAEEIGIFNGSIDGNGHANVNKDIARTENAPGVMKANFKVKVMEEGGAFSVDRFSMPYYSYETYTGIRLLNEDDHRYMHFTDTNHVIDIVTVNTDGKPVSGKKIEMKIYKVDWRWWWDRSSENISAFLTNNSRLPIASETVTTVNGKAKWTFRVNSPDWGRYYIRAYDPESKHSTGKIIYLDWPGWAGRTREGGQGGTTLLSFTTDKEKYNVGEKVTLSIPSSANGRALVSLESGSKVVKTFWVETKAGKTDYSFDATEDMTPNVFVNVTLLQPHAQTKNDLPIRMYGVLPIKVEDPATHLKPVLTMKDELRPEENVTVSIRESNGKPMTYTIAVVDEGLLDLTRFKTPDPWNHFYAREALGVNTWDMYDHVIGAFGDKLDKVLAIGGDGEIRGGEKNKANRFKPVVIFLGPFKMDANSTATHTFKMPQYVGSVKAMVVAGNPKGAYGNAEKTVPVRKPLMLLATLPRVLGPEEQVALPVNVFAMTKNVKNVKLEVKTNGMFDLMDASSKSITFAQPGDEVVNFNLKVKPMTGVGKVSVTASSGNEKATYDISIDIRNPNQKTTKIIEAILQPNQEWVSDYVPFGVQGTNSGTLEISTIPPINLGERLSYLLQYPYGCIEQTTSSVFPQLCIKDFIQSPDIIKRAEQNIKAGILRLRTFQLPDGGLGYWSGASEHADSWGTTYAGHFMLEAEKKGYALPIGFISQWKKYQKKEARNWDGNYDYKNHNYYNGDELDQAYRLYTLALANEPEIGAMNRLRERKNLSTAAKWRLAAAYHLAGQTEVAKNLISGTPITVAKYRELGNNFGSDTRDKAMILEVVSMLGLKGQALPLLKDISAAMSGKSYWMSTQEIAYCLLAVSKYSLMGQAPSKIDFNYSINDEKSIRAITDMKIAQVDMKVKHTAGKVSLKNNSSGHLYVRIILAGIPSAGTEERQDNNLNVVVTYKTKDGNELSDISKLEQGTDFMAEVSIQNPGMLGYYENLALKQVFPSGWEIHNARMDGTDELLQAKRRRRNYYPYNQDQGTEEDGKTPVTLSIPTYRDIRDDRVYTFFDLSPNETKTFRVMLNAAYLGKFYLPAINVEAMYDGSINSVIPGRWVEVVQPGGSNTP